jgi:hypothetical protein
MVWILCALIIGVEEKTRTEGVRVKCQNSTLALDPDAIYLTGSDELNFGKLLHPNLSLWKGVDPGGFLLHRNR